MKKLLLLLMFVSFWAQGQHGGFNYNEEDGTAVLGGVTYHQVDNFLTDHANDRQEGISPTVSLFGLEWNVEFARINGLWVETATTSNRNTRNTYYTHEWRFTFYQDDQGIYRVWSPDGNYGSSRHWTTGLSNSNIDDLRTATFRAVAIGLLSD